jgi:hypothetical protein
MLDCFLILVYNIGPQTIQIFAKNVGQLLAYANNLSVEVIELNGTGTHNG